DVTARAAVVNGVAYFPDWAGKLYAGNANNGKLILSHQLSYYEWAPGKKLAAGTGFPTSPAVGKGVEINRARRVPSRPTRGRLAAGDRCEDGQPQMDGSARYLEPCSGDYRFTGRGQRYRVCEHDLE